MTEPVECVCGSQEPPTICRSVFREGEVRLICACGLAGPWAPNGERATWEWLKMQHALKHHDLLTGFVEEVKAQTASANTADMAALHSMAVAVQKESEE